MTTNAKGQVLYDASDALALSAQASKVLASAQIVIDSDILLAIAGEELKSVKGLQQQVEERRSAITRPLNQALKMVNELFRAPRDYLEQAEQALKQAILRYTLAQEAAAAAARQRAEAQARLERQALKEQQCARERAAQEEELAAARALEHAQRAAKAGDLGAVSRAETEAQLHAAAAQCARDDAQCAAATADVLTLPVAVAAPARLEGVSGRITYTAQVTDLMALVQAVARGAAPAQCVCANDRFIATQARAFKREGILYPGVEAKVQRSLAARAQ